MTRTYKEFSIMQENKQPNKKWAKYFNRFVPKKIYGL